MSTTKLHPSLPAPVVHAGFSVSQSKSNVLAGLQDAYWSDDEAEDAECPLCLEEMDISDLNFKPCVCGYQICRFCWHHIKQNLNKRCPACRRLYTDEGVEFKPMSASDHKRLTQQKKQRERERKELEVLGRKQLANVRVVQRNVVYVVGIGPRFAKEELIPTLRSSEYFGQYGKITKIILVKRTPSGGGDPVVGLYITYYRREDAARAIAAVDGNVSPSGGREVMVASHGTTKYCMSFLRGVSCGDHNCMNLHEWGDEKDCFTKEDLTTLKHTMKASETRSKTVITTKKGEEAEALPRTAAWGSKPAVATIGPVFSSSSPSLTPTRQSRRGNTRQPRNVPSSNEARSGNKERKGSAANKTPSSSRPATPSLPARPMSPPDAKLAKIRKEHPLPSQSPVPSNTGSESSTPSPPDRPQSSEIPSTPSVPPGLPSVPPGLSAPPGIPHPRPSRPDTASPQTPLLASQTSYQMSNAARFLLEDYNARQEAAPQVANGHSPFPDFDRTLNNLTGNDDFGGFSFNLDPSLATSDVENEGILPDIDIEASSAFNGTYVDAFPALRVPGQRTASPFMAPPGITYPHNPSRSIYDPLAVRNTPSVPPQVERQSTGGTSYMGSFNPFADNGEDSTASPTRRSSAEEDSPRKVSRFNFARGRQGSNTTSSPLHAPSPLSPSSDLNHTLYNSPDMNQSPSTQSTWSLHGYPQSGSAVSSPMLQHAQAQMHYMPPPQSSHQPNGRFQPFDSSVSELQLRDFIQSSQSGTPIVMRGLGDDQQAAYKMHSSQRRFADPAIMSARMASPVEPNYIPMDHQAMSFGPPPGLVFPPNPQVMVDQGPPGLNTVQNGPVHEDGVPELSSSDFPALSAPDILSPRKEDTVSPITPTEPSQKAIEKAERKAAKQIAAAERAAERQRVAQEKASLRAIEKARIAQEKAIEKEKAALLKAELDKEKTRLEKVAKDERERQMKLERDRLVAKQEKEKLAQTEREKERAKKVAAAKAMEGVRIPRRTEQTKESLSKAASYAEPSVQLPLLSKKPKKNKPIARLPRIPKELPEEHTPEETPTIPNAFDVPSLSFRDTSSGYSSDNSRAQSVERDTPISVSELLEKIHMLTPSMNLPAHPFFDTTKINPAAKMPLEYGPLVHALAALSVGGRSFANNVPSGCIDNAVSSFQQLLETLTQTISDLLRLLSRITGDDSSSFDGVLKDMLKGDEFMDDTGEEGSGKEDEVTVRTLGLERSARWMEVQLTKLEELHRDINTAAVKAVFAYNDSGWDRYGFLPHVGNTLKRFENLGLVEDMETGLTRPMTADELEKKLLVAREASVFAETEVREMMEKMQAIRPLDEDEDED